MTAQTFWYLTLCLVIPSLLVQVCVYICVQVHSTYMYTCVIPDMMLRSWSVTCSYMYVGAVIVTQSEPRGTIVRAYQSMHIYSPEYSNFKTTGCAGSFMKHPTVTCDILCSDIAGYPYSMDTESVGCTCALSVVTL